MSCKPLKDCPSLLTSIDEADPNNIFKDFLTPCKDKDTYVCLDQLDLAEMSTNCNCKPLLQCPKLMEEYVTRRNWNGLNLIPKCGFVDSDPKSPKYCC